MPVIAQKALLSRFEPQHALSRGNLIYPYHTRLCFWDQQSLSLTQFLLSWGQSSLYLTHTPNPEGHVPLSLTSPSTLAGDPHTSVSSKHPTPRDHLDESMRDTGRETNVSMLCILLDSFQRNGFSSSLLKLHCSLL